MSQSYTKYEVGERVLVFIDDVNHPTGWWEAVVTECKDRGLIWSGPQKKEIPWYEVTCTFDDPRLLLKTGTGMYSGATVTGYANVYPVTVRWVVEALDRCRADAEAAAAVARNREAALLEAIRTLGASGLPGLVERLEAGVKALEAKP